MRSPCVQQAHQTLGAGAPRLHTSATLRSRTHRIPTRRKGGSGYLVRSVWMLNYPRAMCMHASPQDGCARRHIVDVSRQGSKCSWYLLNTEVGRSIAKVAECVENVEGSRPITSDDVAGSSFCAPRFVPQRLVALLQADGPDELLPCPARSVPLRDDPPRVSAGPCNRVQDR